MKSRWFPVYCLGKRTGNWRRTSHREQNMAPRGPLPYSQKNGGKKPKNVAGETGAGRRHGAIHFISRKRKPTAFYILKTGNFYQITPRNGASCSNLLNSNIGIFFPISPQGKIFSPKPKTSTYLLTTLTANTEIPIWIDGWASNLTFTPPKHRIK